MGAATPIFADRAENAEIWDVDGRRYVDFAAGIAVLNTGHRHPKIMQAVHSQLERFTHTAFQVVAYEPAIELAERLNAIAPFEGAAKTVFFTTGAEAVENAVKIARAKTGRRGVIAFTGGFHGRTLLAMALTGKTAPYKRSFGPVAGEVYHLPFPTDFNGVSVEDSLKALSFLFIADIDPASVAAIIVEPVQGEGGFHVAPVELLKALRAICDRHGIVLIADEIQTGFARCGTMFAIQQSKVEPDLVTVAKSLAGGFPLSGVIGRAELMDAVEVGGLGGTYAGSPVACAAALAVLEVIREEQLCDRASAIGERLRNRIAAMGRRNDLLPISPPRGLGAMVAFDVLKARGEREGDGVAAKRVAAEALKAGLLLLTAGHQGETIRILAPLTASDELIDEGLGILEGALKAS